MWCVNKKIKKWCCRLELELCLRSALKKLNGKGFEYEISIHIYIYILVITFNFPPTSFQECRNLWKQMFLFRENPSWPRTKLWQAWSPLKSWRKYCQVFLHRMWSKKKPSQQKKLSLRFIRRGGLQRPWGPDHLGIRFEELLCSKRLQKFHLDLFHWFLQVLLHLLYLW